jgi:hypothetical protein
MPVWANQQDDVHFFAEPAVPVGAFHAIAAVNAVLRKNLRAQFSIAPESFSAVSGTPEERDLSDISGFTCPGGTNSQKPMKMPNRSGADVANCMGIVVPPS